METSIFRYIIRHSGRQQVFLLALTLVSFPFLYYSLDLPKIIINEAIGGRDFPKALLGREVEQIEYLLILCFVFLALVLINGCFKYFLNVYRGQLGERMLRRLRYLLFSRVLRFPLPHFRRMSQGEVISMITAEVEPLGGFIGDAMALPAFQGGTLLTILAFMFVQDWVLGCSAVVLYPLQMYLIPRLQKRINALAKQRVRTVRQLSQRIGETVSGIQEVHAHDTSELELADISDRLGTIYTIRYDIYRRKFLIKFINNFIAFVTPFFFFSIGGYLVINESLTLGALVAVLAAYKDLSGPWKELLRYYQMKEDARIKYEQLVDQFQPAGMLDEALQRPEPDGVAALEGTLVATNLTLEEDGGMKVIDGATFTVEVAARTAIVGPGGAGRSALSQLLARLLMPSAGSIRIGDHGLGGLHEAVTGRRLAYVGDNASLFSGSVRDNLFYGLKHRPTRPADYDQEGQLRRQAFVHEAAASGNTESDLGADWIDYEAAGVPGPEELVERAIEVLGAVELEADIYELGLLGTIDPSAEPELAGRILDARAVLRDRLKDPAMASLVEPFDRDRYAVNTTVAENLLFGTPIGESFDLEHLGENSYVRSVLDRTGLTGIFQAMGLKLAGIMVELFMDLPPDHEYFERFSFIGADALPEFQNLHRKAEAGGAGQLEEGERNMLLSLPFKLIPARHRLGLIDADFQQRILDARRVFAGGLPSDLADSVAFFDQDSYNGATTLQDNILFGKLVYGRQQSRQEVGRLIGEVVDTLGLRRRILELGLDSAVGIGGSRLPAAQRQKLAIARCLLKRPDILIVDGATASLDPAAQQTIMDNVFRDLAGRGVVWVLNRAEEAQRFERVIVMDGGKVVEQGSYADLNRPGKTFHGLAAVD